VFAGARCITEQLRGKCFTFHLKCFVQNVVILVEMCQKKGNITCCLELEVKPVLFKVTEVIVRERVNAVKDKESVRYTIVFGEYALRGKACV
jgi:hypothetical protein